MKQNKAPLIILTAITIYIFKNSIVIQESILNGCNMFFTKVFPSLFPMMILTDCFVYFDVPNIIFKYLGNTFQHLFGLSSHGIFAFLTSTFSGSPANAYLLKNLVEKQYLSNEEASRILSYAFFSNPLFLYSMLSFIFPNDFITVIKLLLLPYFINILIGIGMRKSNYINVFLEQEKKNDFGVMISQSIRNTMNTLLFVLGAICLFFLLNRIINPNNVAFFSGILEISQGLNSFIGIEMAHFWKEILISILISFGGLSIHLQIKGILSDTNISYFSFLKGRMIQCILSVFTLCLIDFLMTF